MGGHERPEPLDGSMAWTGFPKNGFEIQTGIISEIFYSPEREPGHEKITHSNPARAPAGFAPVAAKALGVDGPVFGFSLFDPERGLVEGAPFLLSFRRQRICAGALAWFLGLAGA